MVLDKESKPFCLVLQIVKALMTFDMTIKDLRVSLSQTEIKRLDTVLKETSIFEWIPTNETVGNIGSRFW